MKPSILCAAIVLYAGTAQAQLLTYDLRIASSQPAGVIFHDSHSAEVTGTGQLVNLELYAIIQNLNGDQTDDGFLAGEGSFVSSQSGAAPRLYGVLRGGGTPLTPSQINNVVPFKRTGATSGAPSDYEGDGLIDDVGRNSSTSIGEVNDWFIATAGSDAVFGTDSTNPNPLAQLIGTTSFSVGFVGAAGPGRSARVDFIPRLITVGGPVTQDIHYFNSDNPVIEENYALRGDDPRIARIGSTISWVPEPSSFVLGMIATITVLVLGQMRGGFNAAPFYEKENRS